MKKSLKAAGRVGFIVVFSCLSVATAFAGEAVTGGAEEIESAAVEAPSQTPAAVGRELPIYGESLEPQRIIVTATRIPTPEAQVANSVSVFSAEKMEERQYRTVIEAIKNVPGVSVDRSGGAGSVTQIRIRGLDSGRTVVLMDGMPLNDPSIPNGDFDFSHLTLDNISQLEVLRGPQSTLYGSNASGGVINLTSKRGEGPATGYFSSEGGSRGAAMTRMGVSAGNYIGDFSFAGSFSSTDGISVIDERVFGYTEKDGYRQGSFNLRLGMNPTEILRLDLFANYQKSRFEFDDFPNPYDIEGVSTDNPNLKQRTERFMIRPQVTLSLFDGRWEQTAGFGYVQTERKYRDDPYPGNYLMNWDIWLDDYSSIQRNRYRGETYRFDYKSVFRLHETNTLLAGVDVNTDSIAYQPIYYKKENNPLVPDVTPTVKPGSLTSVGVYLEDQINISDVFFATIGVRQEHHDKFGGKTTWRGSAMYAFPTQTKLKTSAGTGFKAPSLYQLHIGTPAWSIVPNPDLKPETSFGWEAGFEQSLWEDRFTFGAAFFRNQIKDRIDTVYDPLTFTSTYYNIDSYRTWGVESFIQFAITDNLNVSAQYTWLRSDTPRQGWAPYGMFRRPLNEVSANIDWKFLDRGTFTAGVKYIGTRWEGFKVIDHLGNGETGRMPSYTIARIGAAWKFNRHMEVFARVENLFNKKYQEVSGYGTEGIGFFAGATLSF